VATRQLRPKIDSTVDPLLTPSFTGLITKTWEEEPESRPTFAELVVLLESMVCPVASSPKPSKILSGLDSNPKDSDPNNKRKSDNVVNRRIRSIV